MELKVTELPNDMKMLSVLAGELSNSSTHFTTFANVNQSEANYYKKNFGISPNQFGNHMHILKELRMPVK